MIDFNNRGTWQNNHACKKEPDEDPGRGSGGRQRRPPHFMSEVLKFQFSQDRWCDPMPGVLRPIPSRNMDLDPRSAFHDMPDGP
jgi:hypothetical protein